MKQTVLKGMVHFFMNPDLFRKALVDNLRMEFGGFSEEQLNLVADRREICLDCPYFSGNAMRDDSEYKEVVGSAFIFNPMLGEYCGLCGCNYKRKTATLDQRCGVVKFYEENPDKEHKIEPRW
jgi:hypothetical protein